MLGGFLLATNIPSRLSSYKVSIGSKPAIICSLWCGEASRLFKLSQETLYFG